MKEGYKGKVIYNPSGKAQEYSYWAANFYNGCSADCFYCYMKKPPMSQFWSTTPYLKKQLVDKENAIKIFEKELKKNLDSLRKYGLFFSFTSDPMLEVSFDLNMQAICLCLAWKIPVKILTKQTRWIHGLHLWQNLRSDLLSIGFTLTGYDDLEKGASSNFERVKAMELLKNSGYKTWASIEPIINIDRSLLLILKTEKICDHYKIGLLSGKKNYNIYQLHNFVTTVNNLNIKVYWKDGLLKQAGIGRKDLPSNCVDRDYLQEN